MICVRLIKDGFRCDMCFQKPNYEIIADDRYNDGRQPTHQKF